MRLRAQTGTAESTRADCRAADERARRFHIPVAGAPADLQSHLGYWLRLVSNAVSQSFARKVETEGVTVAEWVFLRMLYDVDAISPSALAGRMGMTRGAITKLGDRLVTKDLLLRVANAEGGRGQSLALTASARILVPRLAALADENDADFFGSLSGPERQTMERLLRKIALDRALTKPPTE